MSDYYIVSVKVDPHNPRSRRMQKRRCAACGYVCSATAAQCPYCRRELTRRIRKNRPKARPKHGTPERLQLELAKAQRLSDQWASKAKRAVGLAHYYQKRERALAAKLAYVPPPPPQPPRRGIEFRKGG